MKLIRGFREPDNVGKEDCQLLALAFDLDLLLSAEDCLIELRRDIFGQLCGYTFQRTVGDLRAFSAVEQALFRN